MSRLLGDIPELDRVGLRRFGLVTGGILAGLFGLLLPWLLERPFPMWPWVPAGVLVLWALVAPATLRGFYRGWMRVGHAIGWVNTRILLLLVFYVLLLPLGLLLRVTGHDPLARRLHTGQESYRVSRSGRTTDMQKPF